MSIGHDEVRLRQSGMRKKLSVKKGSGLIRQETEVEITEEQFATLWPCTEGRRLEKTRYRLAYQGLTIELDVFAGDLSGLMVAEVEFPDRDAADHFQAPTWFGEELTGTAGWSNASLALDGLPGEGR